MQVHIAVIGVLLAALSAILIGMIWYSQPVFGKVWMKMIGTKDKEMKARMGMATVVLIIVALITAYVLAYFIVYTHSYTGGGWIAAGAETALWAWLGLAVTTIVAHGVFDPRDRMVMYINIGNRLVTLLAMGLIIGAFMH